MTPLQLAFINVFKEIYATGREILDHPDFMFRIECTVGLRPDDAKHSNEINSRIMEALEIAKVAVKPVTIEGTTLQ
jgi:hypothetical protein